MGKKIKTLEKFIEERMKTLESRAKEFAEDGNIESANHEWAAYHELETEILPKIKDLMWDPMKDCNYGEPW